MKSFRLEATVFATGAIVMILELAGSRVLGPYFGNSVYIWTGLIGVILGSLSLGYWWGGRLADRHPVKGALSLILLGAGVWVALTAAGKESLLAAIKGGFGDFRVRAVLATTLLFAPPGVLLGMVAPYAVRLKMGGVESSGRTVGNLYALSTVGSIVGTFLTGFFLLSFMGITKLLFSLAAVLVLLSLLVAARDFPASKAALALLCLAGAAHARRAAAARARAGFVDVDSDYNRIWIRDGTDPLTGRPIREILTDPYGGQTVFYRDDYEDLHPGYMRFFRLAGHFRPGLRKALTIGGAGYASPRDFLRRHPGARMDVVEIDPAFTELSRRYLGLRDAPGLRIVHEDARTLLDRTDERYEAVFVDAFQSTFTPPFQLATVEAARLYRRVLTDDGVLLMNVVSTIEGPSGKYFRAQLATLKEVFPRVLVFPVMVPENPEAWQSLVLVALKSPGPASAASSDPELQSYLSHLWRKEISSDMPLLTDDFAPVENLLLHAVAALERRP